MWRNCPGLGMQDLWAHVVGVDIAGNTRVVTLREGVLTISCSSGGWACELGLAAAELKGRLNAASPPQNIREIRFIHQAQAGPKSRK